MKTLSYSLVLGLALAAAACSGSKEAATPEIPAASAVTAQPAPDTTAPTVMVGGARFGFADRIPFDDSIRVDTLDNGVRVYVAHNGRPENRAELRLAVDAGSLLEDDDQLGLAHFVEHMAFNGTENFAKHEIIDYMERHGMQMGPHLNAYTSFDETVYMLTVPTDTLEVLETGIRILRDWADNVSFEPEEIDKERGVVIEEWRGRRGAFARMSDKQLPVILHESRYAERLPIGDPEIIENVDYETIMRFYRDWYRSDLMAVVAVGDFDVDYMFNLIRDTFSQIEPHEEKRERETFAIPGHEETLIAPATDPEAPYGSAMVLYKRDRKPEGTIDAYRRAILAGLYHGMFNDRLGELVQSSDPPFAFAASGDGSFARTAEFYMLNALVREAGVERALEALLVEAERVRLHGFTATELARSKEAMLRAYEKAYDERDKSESSQFAAEYIRNFLEDESVPGIAFEYRLVESLLPGVTLEEINSLTSRFMSEENRVVTMSGPERQGFELPSDETVLGLFAAAQAANPDPFVDKTLDEPLIPVLPVAGTITEESSIDTLGLTYLTLSNGARAILKPTDFKNDQIVMRGFSFGGASLYPDSVYIAAVTAGTVVGMGGLGNFGPIELDKALTGKVANISASVGEDAESIGGSASPKDLETAFQLMHLYFTASRTDQEAFDSYQTRMRELLESTRVSPERAFYDTVRVVMSQRHFRARPQGEETLAEMDIDKSHEIFRERFADASDFTFVFVGAFENEEIKPLIEQYLASLPSTYSNESRLDVGIRAPTGVVEREIVKGIEPKSRVLLSFTGPFAWEHERRMQFQTFADVLRIKLREVLREDMGGTYGVSVGARSDRFPEGRYSLNVSFGCDPERVDELVGEFMVQVDSLHQYGLGEPYLEKAREIRRRKHEEALKQNGYWLGAIGFVERHDEDPMTILEGYTEFMTRLDQDMMKDAAQQYLNLDNYAKFVLLPESTAEEPPSPEPGSGTE